VAGGGPLVLAWLDSRDGQRGLRAIRSRDGLHFEPEGTVDAKTCECCGTNLLAGAGGEVWLAYRDATAENVRDIYLAASRDRGAHFEIPRPVANDGWKLNGCPESGPKLAQTEDGSLWAVWFTGAQPGIYAAASQDGGASFGPRQPLATLGDGLDGARHPEIGVLPDGRLAVLYETFRDGEGHRIEARLRQTEGGAWSEPVVVDSDAAFPRLASRAGRAAVAFTRQRGDRNEVVIRDWTGLFAAAD
jgi:hypothetical protein